ncbi:MAG: hypothetical protein AAB354_09705 [candidate division KSB1 bacterium]
MPRQNRVTPFGEIIATPARGTLLGNRGCLHNPRQQIIKKFQSARWIICVLEFKGRRHGIMTPGQYTELFFLDEATALAAGHRPCAECSRPRFETFRALWAGANPELAHGPKPLATTIDRELHAERIDAAHGKVTYIEKLNALPDGCFVTLADGKAYLVYQNFLRAWQAEGYGNRLAPTSADSVRVLTPRSIVKTLAAGYAAALHASAL